MGQLSERLNRLSPGDIALVIVALMMPPIAVLLKVGLTTHFWINVLLTILGFIPGQIHGLWVVLFL
ncbi:MAG: Plasma membrane proteolipid [Candidatus Collierbacteria bacterium GW2011_GWF2_44_15]|uniref:Plasma membrane proteolipid n=3 Tax=Candidatus Collieribacteriota TaxID=1752725 RepID=A0A0G1HGX9_9BACT|nr:MAG: Plasma membrane proteolipid [Candidatus Collierbacteria bacterium GW2011_GWA1_44_12]KKT45783.1 MAG: Plasma membrane proteolipid [Candidatus Collierbacteria bacterium GW2011_GWF2_44_15]KKU28388.1 MAG: Plasma membrane proteolipid [Candidatus Collierbacteria bacterium GW2011_GWE1_46_18]